MLCTRDDGVSVVADRVFDLVSAFLDRVSVDQVAAFQANDFRSGKRPGAGQGQRKPTA
jgi:hypothetical protein